MRACQTHHAIILAAGESRRTRPLTLQRPKPLISLLGKPLLAHILDELVGIVDQATLVVGYRAEAIRDYFGMNYRGIALAYVHQQEANGTAGALLTVMQQEANEAMPPLNEPFFLLYGDNLISRVDVLNACRHRYAMAAMPVDDPTSFGILEIVEGSVQRIIEKPATAAPGALANPGIYHFDGEVFPALQQIRPSPRGEYELTDLIALLAQKERVDYFVCEGYWLPVGTPWDALTTSMFLLKHWTARGLLAPVGIGDAELQGIGRVGGGWMQRDAHVIGPSYIGDGVVIGTGSRVEHCVIEDGVTIGEHCLIEHSVLGAGVKIGSNCVVQSSLLDTEASLGDGCRLMARVFDDVTPVALTTGFLSHQALRQRGAVVGSAIRLPLGTTLEPGSVLFPEQHEHPPA